MYIIIKSVCDCIYEQTGWYELEYEFNNYKDALNKRNELENNLNSYEKGCMEYWIEKDGEIIYGE